MKPLFLLFVIFAFLNAFSNDFSDCFQIVIPKKDRGNVFQWTINLENEFLNNPQYFFDDEYEIAMKQDGLDKSCIPVVVYSSLDSWKTYAHEFDQDTIFIQLLNSEPNNTIPQVQWFTDKRTDANYTVLHVVDSKKMINQSTFKLVADAIINAIKKRTNEVKRPESTTDIPESMVDLFAHIKKSKLIYSLENDKEKREHTIHYLHLENKDGDPIILSHCLSFNGYAMMNWAKLFYDAGYDVWIPHARGHGPNSKLTTTVAEPKHGDFLFEKMVTEDAPHFLEYVYGIHEKRKKHPTPVIVLGHSMGGMTWERYLSGVSEDEKGNTIQSDDLAHERAKKIKCLVVLASPADFKDFDSNLKMRAKLSSYITSLGDYYIPVKFFQKERVLVPEFVRSILRQRMQRKFIDNSIPGLHDCERLKADPFFKTNYIKMMISNPHSEYLREFFSWVQNENYLSHDGLVNFAINKWVHVPTLYFSGDKDLLASSSSIAKIGNEYPLETPLHIVNMHSFMHVDFLFQDGIQKLGQMVLSFAERPNDFSLRQESDCHPIDQNNQRDIKDVVIPDEAEIILSRSKGVFGLSSVNLK